MKQDIKDRISAKVADLERLSSIEYVPVFVERSATYFYFRTTCAFFAALLVLAGFHLHGWGYSTLGVLAGALVAGLLVHLALRTRPVLARLLPNELKRGEVERGARLKFAEHEVFATAERTGVLIYVSELEKSVYLLEDKGIAAKVDLKELNAIAAVLAEEFDRNGSGDTFFKALEALSARLAKDFPPHERNPNELPDGVRG